MSLLSQERSFKGLQTSIRVVEEKGQTCMAHIADGVSDTYVLTFTIDNTSTNKSWILDSGSVVHACSQKMFNSLVAKEEGTVKMVDGSAWKVSDIETVNVTGRDGTMRASTAVRYVPEVDTI